MIAISPRYSATVPWIAIAATAIAFPVLYRGSKLLARRFERQVRYAVASQARQA